jgi:hypothetical protein
LVTAGDTSLAVLVGNGLSIAVNDSLRLDRLTADFLDRHAADRDDLERLVAGVNLGPVAPTEDFEGLVAGLESAEEVIGAFMGLARRVDHADLREAADLLDRKGVPALARRLYYAYCAEVLDAIGEHAKGPLPDPAVAFGQWVKAMYQAHGRMGLFTLNYDVLLERMFVSENVLSLRPALTDFFSGLEDRQEWFQLVPGAGSILGRLFYPEDPVDRPIELHHLHGCLTHFRMNDGAIWKFDSSDVRDLGVYEHLMSAEAAEFAPSVILGSRKVEKSREWPFSFAFLSLEQEARASRTVVVAGYSFRDEAVNARLAAAAASAEKRWIVVNKKEDEAEAEEFRDLVTGKLRPAAPEFALRGFALDLPEVG